MWGKSRPFLGGEGKKGMEKKEGVFERKMRFIPIGKKRPALRETRVQVYGFLQINSAGQRFVNAVSVGGDKVRIRNFDIVFRILKIWPYLSRIARNMQQFNFIKRS